MEMEQLKKVIQDIENENAEKNEEQVEVDEEYEIELSDMDKLPSEILMKILDYLDEKQLVKCRLLSCQWNEICCLLLQNKSKINPDSKLIIQLKENMNCQIENSTKSLADFIACFAPPEAEKSSDSDRLRPFPFSRFSVQSLNLNVDVTPLCEFVSTFGPQMKTFSVNINMFSKISDFQRVWKLLLYFAPNIQHLKIIGDSCLKDVVLFDPINKFIAKADPNFKERSPKDTFLENLIKLEIVSPDFGQFNNFMKDLLDNTPNLEEVSSMDSDCAGNYHKLEHLEVWQQLNKAHLLKNLEIKSDSRSNSSPFELMKNLRLVNLRADCSINFGSNDKKSPANYICHALKSSQDTLSFLDLYNLTMVNEFCFKGISSLPNVRQLQLTPRDPTETVEILQELSYLCPNTTILNLGFVGRYFSDVASILWTGFKALQSLKFSLIIYGQRHHLDLDSGFSGYSTTSIQKIQKQLRHGISLEEARRGERQNPSISDLKDLRELEVGFIQRRKSGQNLEDQVENSLFLKLLPRLHTKKLWVRSYKDVFSTGSNSDSDYEINQDELEYAYDEDYDSGSELLY